MYHAEGVLRKKDGSSYNGGWKVGLRHGDGIQYYAVGEKYEGEWAGNLKHGYGRDYKKDGKSKAQSYNRGFKR